MIDGLAPAPGHPQFQLQPQRIINDWSRTPLYTSSKNIFNLHKNENITFQKTQYKGFNTYNNNNTTKIKKNPNPKRGESNKDICYYNAKISEIARFHF